MSQDDVQQLEQLVVDEWPSIRAWRAFRRSVAAVDESDASGASSIASMLLADERFLRDSIAALSLTERTSVPILEVRDHLDTCQRAALAVQRLSVEALGARVRNDLEASREIRREAFATCDVAGEALLEAGHRFRRHVSTHTGADGLAAPSGSRAETVISPTIPEESRPIITEADPGSLPISGTAESERRLADRREALLRRAEMLRRPESPADTAPAQSSSSAEPARPESAPTHADMAPPETNVDTSEPAILDAPSVPAPPPADIAVAVDHEPPLTDEEPAPIEASGVVVDEEPAPIDELAEATERTASDHVSLEGPELVSDVDDSSTVIDLRTDVSDPPPLGGPIERPVADIAATASAVEEAARPEVGWDTPGFADLLDGDSTSGTHESAVSTVEVEDAEAEWPSWNVSGFVPAGSPGPEVIDLREPKPPSIPRPDVETIDAEVVTERPPPKFTVAVDPPLESTWKAPETIAAEARTLIEQQRVAEPFDPDLMTSPSRTRSRSKREIVKHERAVARANDRADRERRRDELALERDLIKASQDERRQAGGEIRSRPTWVGQLVYLLVVFGLLGAVVAGVWVLVAGT